MFWNRKKHVLTEVERRWERSLSDPGPEIMLHELRLADFSSNAVRYGERDRKVVHSCSM